MVTMRVLNVTVIRDEQQNSFLLQNKGKTIFRSGSSVLNSKEVSLNMCTQIPYLEHWKVENIDLKDNKRFRLFLKKDCSQKDSGLIVLMMNPSNANCERSDPTTNNVLAIAGNSFNNYNQVTTINVVPDIASNSKDTLDEGQEEIDKSNIDIVTEIIESKLPVLIATGNLNRSRLRKAYKNILDIILSNKNDCFVIGINKSGYALHPADISLERSLFKEGSVFFKKNCDNLKFKSINIHKNNGKFSLNEVN